MSVLIKGGTIVNADQTFSAEVLCRNGIIDAIGQDLDDAGAEIIDASGCCVMPRRH